MENSRGTSNYYKVLNYGHFPLLAQSLDQVINLSYDKLYQKAIGSNFNDSLL